MIDDPQNCLHYNKFFLFFAFYRGFSNQKAVVPFKNIKHIIWVLGHNLFLLVDVSIFRLYFNQDILFNR